MGLDVPQAVVPAVGAAGADAQLAQRQVEVVADHQEVRGFHLMKVEGLADAAATQIHKGFRLDQQEGLAAVVQLGHLGLEPTAEPRGVLGQQVDDVEADVVPGARVLRAGVAEADDDLHGCQWSVVRCPL